MSNISKLVFRIRGVIFMILIMIVAGGTQQSLVLGIESLESTQSLTKVFKTYQEFKKNQ